MNIINSVFQLVGSLGLFIFGMKIMSEGIQKAAGHKMKSILNFMTGNRFAAVFTGFAITAIIQSSSATTVMVVSFVNANLMSLAQSIGVIMGANIGTTVTGWMVAILGFKVKVTALAIPAVAIGFPFIIIKSLKKSDWGEILIGFGILFLGLGFLKDSVPDISQNPEALKFLANLSGTGLGTMALFVLAGTLLTVLVQSSSASMAITLTMANAGWFGYEAAAAIVLGQNIGTTVTAYLASIGTNLNARRASRAHILFNVLGTIWVLVLLNPLLQFVNFIVPGDVYTSEAFYLLPTHLAMFHTVFNIVNTIIFLPFIQNFAKLVIRLVPGEEKAAAPWSKYTYSYISAFQETPEIYLLKVQDEIHKMAVIIQDMFIRFRQVFESPDRDMGNEVEELKKIEEYTDQMQVELTHYMSELVKESLTSNSADNLNCMLRIVNELESVADSCYNLILLTERKYNNNIFLDEEAHNQLYDYNNLVQTFITFIKDRLNRHIDDSELRMAIEYEEHIDNMRNTIRESAQKRIKSGTEVKSELYMLDYIQHLEHIGDYLINIAEALDTMH